MGIGVNRPAINDVFGASDRRRSIGRQKRDEIGDFFQLGGSVRNFVCEAAILDLMEVSDGTTQGTPHS